MSRNIDLVYGGGSIGLMGLVSQAVYDGGRHVIGWVFSSSSFVLFSIMDFKMMMIIIIKRKAKQMMSLLGFLFFIN